VKFQTLFFLSWHSLLLFKGGQSFFLRYQTISRKYQRIPSYIFCLSCNAKVTCNKRNYQSNQPTPDRSINTNVSASNNRTCLVDVAAGDDYTNHHHQRHLPSVETIARTILLLTTLMKFENSSSEARSEWSYLWIFNVSSLDTTVDVGKEISSSNKGPNITYWRKRIKKITLNTTFIEKLNS
jgi:hypothetical protein